VQALLTAWNRPGQHRDVRIAITASLVPFFGDPRAAAALADAATSSLVHLAMAVAGVSPRRVPPVRRPAFAQLVRQVTAHPDGPAAAPAVPALIEWLRWAPEAGDDLLDRLRILRRHVQPDVRDAALRVHTARA
jgi:hypothetical protein